MGGGYVRGLDVARRIKTRVCIGRRAATRPFSQSSAYEILQRNPENLFLFSRLTDQQRRSTHLANSRFYAFNIPLIGFTFRHLLCGDRLSSLPYHLNSLLIEIA